MNQMTRLSPVDRADADLSIVAQCRLLNVARSRLYYRAAPVIADDLRLMRRLDEQYLATPFYGSRRMVALLRRSGEAVNRKRVRRLMRLMGLGSSAKTVGGSRCVTCGAAVGCGDVAGFGWQRLTGRHGQLCLGHADRRQALRLRRTAARLRGLTATRMAEGLALVPSMTRSVRRRGGA